MYGWLLLQTDNFVLCIAFIWIPSLPQLNPEPTPATAKLQAGEIWIRECTKRAWVLTSGEPQGVMGMLQVSLAVKQACCLLVLVVCARLYFAELSILGIWR